ncbi:MAG TPA: hypothetical protein VGW77_22715 [Candidatus Binatia bacterium]|nr:hypothetical protein [Candidatus Binatia bacterium]
MPDRAALCQILRDGVTGFVSSSLDDLVAAVQKIPDISRRKCRDEFERRFTAGVMAANYERVYYQLASMDWLNMRQIAARPTRHFADARYAARQWRPALNRERLNTRWKERGSDRQIFSNAHDADTVTEKSSIPKLGFRSLPLKEQEDSP